MFRMITANDKNMANGMRNMSRTPLSEEEIAFVKSEINALGADEDVFVFNDERHILLSTCYNFYEDKVYVTRNVFPDDKYGSTHPRDLMSVRAVLAHEYYGHRTYRDEYLSDAEHGYDYHTTPVWQDAIYRAKEFGQLIEMDDFMKEAIYGYTNGEKNITRNITPINFVSESSQIGAGTDGNYHDEMS